MSTVQSTVETEINYEIMAKAFWGMGSSEQAKFFECLRQEIAKSQSRDKTHLYMMGEMQWYYMADELKKDGKITPAGEMLMAMAAPLFTHLTEWLGRDGKSIPCAFYEDDRPQHWKSIETAPKDCAFLGYQRISDDMWIVAPMYWAGSEYLFLQFHSDNSEHSANPTHWMNLPEGPL